MTEQQRLEVAVEALCEEPAFLYESRLGVLTVLADLLEEEGGDEELVTGLRACHATQSCPYRFKTPERPYGWVRTKTTLREVSCDLPPETFDRLEGQTVEVPGYADYSTWQAAVRALGRAVRVHVRD